MTTKHTPGPWNVTTSSAAHSVRNQRGERICTVNTAVTDQLAKARLIAAAPELLAALAGMIEMATHHAMDDGEKRAILRAARAAIAKAKGE